MIYEITCSENVHLDYNIFALRPSHKIGYFVFLISLLALVVYILFTSRRVDARRVEGWATLLIPSGLFLGLFTATFGIIDEVSVNLEHAYNLRHFGLFSMSSIDQVDGTVELLFYLLHTPFAYDLPTLILGNYLICLLIGWLHIFVLWKSRWFLNSSSPLVSLSCFSICATVVTMLSTGFGNGLVSLLYLIGIVCLASRRDKLALVVCGLLPIVRPDGLLLSFANILVVSGLLARDWISERRCPPLKIYLLLMVLPIVSFGVYMAVFSQVFHVWPPTPIMFKQVDASAIAHFSLRRFGGLLVRWMQQPEHTAAVAVVCALLWKLPKNRDLQKLHSTDFVLLCQVVVMTPVFLFYNFGLSSREDFSGHTMQRYWLAFEIVIALILIKKGGEMSVAARPQGFLRRAPLLPALFLFLLLAVFPPYFRIEWALVDRKECAFAGAFTESILPPDFTISTSEMNTFGLMINRPVIDLWGYSTRDIAMSKIFSKGRLRNNPEYFLKVSPDVYWPYWMTSIVERRRDILSTHSDNSSLSVPFNGLFDDFGAERNMVNGAFLVFNLLGDMTRVIHEYDILIVNFHQGTVVYLVRKVKIDELIDSVAAKYCVISRRNRVFNQELFQQYYR